MKLQQSTILNRLLALLPVAEFAVIAPMLEPVQLPLRAVLAEPDQPVEHVFFVERSLGSILATSPEGQQAEAGIFGREGFAPTALACGLRPHHHALRRQAGSSQRSDCCNCCLPFCSNQRPWAKITRSGSSATSRAAAADAAAPPALKAARA